MKNLTFRPVLVPKRQNKHEKTDARVHRPQLNLVPLQAYRQTADTSVARRRKRGLATKQKEVMKIGIIVAMEKELRQLQSLFKDGDVVVQQCGIGKVNAAIGAAEMIRQHRPDAIISSGCAGGNGDEVNIQDIVVGAQTAYHDVYCGSAVGGSVYGQVQGMPARFDADPLLLRKSLDLPTADDGPKIHQGLIVTGDWFVDSREKMEHIVSLFPEARAVDMESAAIAQTCYAYHVPFISFRVVSDVPLRDHQAAQYHDFWDRMADSSFHMTKSFVESLL